MEQNTCFEVLGYKASFESWPPPSRCFYRVDAIRSVRIPEYGPEAYTRKRFYVFVPYGKKYKVKTGKEAKTEAYRVAEKLIPFSSIVSVFRMIGGSGVGEYLKDDSSVRFDHDWDKVLEDEVYIVRKVEVPQNLEEHEIDELRFIEDIDPKDVAKKMIRLGWTQERVADTWTDIAQWGEKIYDAYTEQKETVN